MRRLREYYLRIRIVQVAIGMSFVILTLYRVLVLYKLWYRVALHNSGSYSISSSKQMVSSRYSSGLVKVFAITSWSTHLFLIVEVEFIQILESA